MATKEQVIEKIKKCLKLSKGTAFQGEADQALVAAMRLAAGIGMTVDEIKLDGEAGSKQEQIGKNTVGKERSKIPHWETILANGIASAIGCELVIHTGWNSNTGKTVETFLLIGTPGDAALFNWLYPYVIQQLRRLCHRDWTSFISSRQILLEANPGYQKPWERSWYRGAALRCMEKAAQTFKQQTTEQEQQQYALVVRSKKEKCAEFMRSSMVVTERAPRPVTVNRSAMEYGYASAEEVSMNRPLESKSTGTIRD